MTNTNEYSTTCQWIGVADHNVLKPTCCAPSIANKSYCAEHVWQVYQEGSAVRRKKDTRRANTLREIVSEFNEVYEELLAEGTVSEH